MSPVKGWPRPAGDTLVLALGAHRIHGAVLGRAGWRDDSAFEVEIETAGAQQRDLGVLAAALRAIPAQSGVARLRVLIADSWLACASFPWSAALQHSAHAERTARTHLALAGFEIDAGATLRLDDAPFGAPRLALAYPAPLLTALAQAAQASGARLDSVLALSVAAWPLAGRHALALQDDGLVVLARGRAGHMDDITVRTVAQVSPRSLQEAWQRQCLRDPQLAALAAVPWLDLTGDAPASAAPPAPFVPVALPQGGVAPSLRLAAASTRRNPLDAVADAPVVAWQRLAVLACAALLALASVAYAFQSGAELKALQQARQAVPRSAAAVSHAAEWSSAELARVQAVNVAVRELNLPFEAILRALEPPRDLRIAVLSMSTTAGMSGSAGTPGSRVKIVAEARTGAEMARYVAFVAERRPFTGAYLIEHEIDQAAAERPYRFTLEATWND